MQYTKPDTGASDMMWDAGTGGAGPFVFGACGEEHTLPDHVTEEQYDNGDYEPIEYVTLNGQNFVYGCEACSAKLAQYEGFIWHERYTIRRYLKLRIDQEKAWADQEKLMNQLAGIDQ